MITALLLNSLPIAFKILFRFSLNNTPAFVGQAGGQAGWKEIYDYIIKHLKKNATNYVFIDEVQNVPEFEKLLEGLYVQPSIDLTSEVIYNTSKPREEQLLLYLTDELKFTNKG